MEESRGSVRHGERTSRVNGKRVYSVQVLAGTRAAGWLTVKPGQYARLADDRAITVTLYNDRIERIR
jgi:hypothetical protein